MASQLRLDDVLIRCAGTLDPNALSDADRAICGQRIGELMANTTDDRDRYVIWLAWARIGDEPTPEDVLSDPSLIALAEGLMAARKKTREY
jgi:hypothetical protein